MFGFEEQFASLVLTFLQQLFIILIGIIERFAVDFFSMFSFPF